MKYRAVLHKVNSGREKVESVWVESKEIAERMGETGLEFYGGTHFTIEESSDESE